MRRFENLLYLFAGVGIGMLISASLYEKEIQKVYEIVEIPKIGDMSDCANEIEIGYYEHLIKTK
jgi:purine-nucleoside phosphorylase